MKKSFYLSVFTILIFLLTLTASKQAQAIPNPWIDCGDDIYCGAKKAGFNLPIRVDNYSVRAMDGMLEIKFPLDKKRSVTLRKTQKYDDKMPDISGVYINYPINKAINIDGIVYNVRGDKKKFYVVNFVAETGYYSFYSEQGLKKSDIQYIYKLLSEAEAPRRQYDEKENLTIEELQELMRVDGIVEPVFTQDCFPRTLQKKGVTKECFERANLGQDSFCSASEIRMIREYYKKGQDKDPLNNGSGDFCAVD
jgi:hypothetical protein